MRVFRLARSPPYETAGLVAVNMCHLAKSFIIFTSVMKRLYKSLMFMCLAVVLGLLSSCSGTDYLNAIPKKSTALISVDMQQMASGKSDEDKAGMLKSLLHVEDASKCGIDISEKIFLFENADGNLGLCAKVSDEGDVEDWLASLAKQHIATEVKERKGFHFSVLKNSWLVGFSDQALLVMGPVVADAQAQLQQQMVKYLKADEGEGITASPMFGTAGNHHLAYAMVAQAQAFAGEVRSSIYPLAHLRIPPLRR